MGLDMYIYKMSKLTDEEVKQIEGKKFDDIIQKNTNYAFIPRADKECDMGSEKTLLSILKPTTILDDYIDMEKLKKETKVPKTAFLTGRCISKNGGTFIFRWGKTRRRSKEINLKFSELVNFVISKPVNVLVCKKQEVQYYRKHYDLQEALYEISSVPIENVSYIAMTDEMIEAVYRFDDEFKMPEMNEGDMLAYYEWY